MLDGKHQGSAGARAATGTSTARRRPPSRAVPASGPQIRPGATPRRNTRCNTWLAPAGPDPRRRHRRRGHLGRIDTHGAGDRPRVRIGRNRWINLLWLPQIGFAVAARIAIPKNRTTILRLSPKHLRLPVDPARESPARGSTRWRTTTATDKPAWPPRPAPASSLPRPATMIAVDVLAFARP
jgi:hypothetical protein